MQQLIIYYTISDNLYDVDTTGYLTEENRCGVKLFQKCLSII
jgi:hypothetical protein